MNLADNLKKIRKEHNLSQEQLADKLGVSRQSVSKWESNLAYPEMDKVLQICKMFNLNIDELLNQDIKKINDSKQSKMNINKYIDDFLGFVTKTIDMFSSMKWKDKIKCILEQCFVVFLIFITFLIIGSFGNYVIDNLFYFLPHNIYKIIYVIFKDLYIIVALILGIILFFHIFKTRYLDYYVIVKNNDDNSSSEDINNDDNYINNISDNKTIFLQKKKEKIIVRDPEVSGYRFISGLFKFLLFIIKLFVVWCGLIFCFSLIGLVILLVTSFMFIKTGMLFLGALLILLSAIVINLIILDGIYSFIVNKKIKKRLLFISFICSLIGIGIGSGLCFIRCINYNVEVDYGIKDEEFIEMNDDMIIVNSWGKTLEFIEEDRDDIRIEIYHSKFFTSYIEKNNKFIHLGIEEYYDNVMDIVRKEIVDINNNKIVDYSSYKVRIYASSSNIDKIKNNYNNMYEDYYDSNY